MSEKTPGPRVSMRDTSAKSVDQEPAEAPSSERLRQSNERIQDLEQRLHAWESLGVDTIARLDEMVQQRISAMASEQRHAEIQIQNQRKMLEIIGRINNLLHSK